MGIVCNILARSLLPVVLLTGFSAGRAEACCCPGVSVTALEGMKNRPVKEEGYYRKHFAVPDMSALEKGEISIHVGDTGNSLLPLTITLPNRYKGKNIRVVVNSVLNYVESAKSQPFTPMSRFTVSLYRIGERDGIQTIKVLDRNGGGVKTIRLGPLCPERVSAAQRGTLQGLCGGHGKGRGRKNCGCPYSFRKNHQSVRPEDLCDVKGACGRVGKKNKPTQFRRAGCRTL